MVLAVPGIDAELLLNIDACKYNNQFVQQVNIPLLPKCSKVKSCLMQIFNELVTTKAPGEKGYLNSPISAFLLLPEKKKSKPQPCNIDQLLACEETLQLNNYPLISEEDNEFVDTLQLSDNDNYHTILSLDCEMCLTAFGLECSRVSLVDFSKKLIYDRLCKPTNPIIDYNTRYA